MISRHIILTVASVEAKTLLRSWFFRVFTILTLGILTLLNIVMFTLSFSQWMHRGMGASVPYTNILLLNMAQAVIAVFLASEFLKFDRKLDTTESIYPRSMTNTDYVIGKTLGIMSVFLGLNVAVLILSFVFNVFFTEVRIIPALYLYYPLILSVPALVFMFGLSFLAMVIIRNQATTFLILLGWTAAALLFLGSRWYGIFDFMGMHVPLMYSDFIGFGNFRVIFLQRGIYFFIGVGCILSTALLLGRLTQSQVVRNATAFLAALSFLCGIASGAVYLKHCTGGVKLRASIRELNRSLANEPAVTITACDLSLTHAGREIEAEARLTFTNGTDQPLTACRFSLNPGFKILRASNGDKSLPVETRLHTFTVTLPEPLSPDEEYSFTLAYTGAPNEDACYADIHDLDRGENLRYWVFTVDNRYGIVDPRYVLLTEEDLWYPVAGIPYGSAFPVVGKRDFIHFTLKVKTRPDYTAISQGSVGSGSPGEFEFVPESPLPQISLVIGKYQKRSVTAEGIDYSLYILPDHDYFSNYFDLIGDQFGTILDEIMFNYEKQINLTYSFPRMSIVETPIQFTSHERSWKAARDIIQPEQIFLPEKGVLLRSADFKMSSSWSQRGGQGGQRGGQGGQRGGSQSSQTPEEIQANLFRNFLQRTFFANTSMMRNFQRGMAAGGFRGGPGEGGGINRIRRMAFTLGGGPAITGDYGLFPQFYPFVNNIHASRFPVFNTVIEQYLKMRGEQSAVPFRMFQGTTVEEEANLLFEQKSLAEILDDPSYAPIAPDALRNKASFLFAAIRSKAGADSFDTFLSNYLLDENFTDIDFDAFNTALKNRFDIDLDPILETWYSGKGVPGYILTDMACRELTIEDRTRYQVTFIITNTARINGVVSASFMVGGSQQGGRGGQRMSFGGPGMMMMSGGGSNENTKIITLNGGESKRIGMVFDNRPIRLTVTTYISRNLPATISRNIGEPQPGSEADFFEGEQTLDRAPATTLPGEIIVNDEDPGFHTVSKTKEPLLKRVLRLGDVEDQTYIPLRPRTPPATWRPTVGDNFYGFQRITARYIRAGNGDNRAVWQAKLNQNGNYDVYFYSSSLPFMQRGGDRGREGGRGGGGERGGRTQMNFLDDYHFFVHHEDGVDEVVLDMKQAKEGWLLLGSYYFSAGEAEIELTDRTKGRVVLADAVKWVKRQDSGEKKE